MNALQLICSNQGGILENLTDKNTKVYFLDAPIQRQSFEPAEPKLAHTLFGQQNRHLRQIERLTGVRLSSKGTTALLEGSGEQLTLSIRLLEELTSLLKTGFNLRSPDIEYADRILRMDSSVKLTDILLWEARKSILNSF